MSLKAISSQCVVTTLVGTPVSTNSLVVDAARNVYVPGKRISPTGQGSGIDTSAAPVSWFYGHAMGADSTYYFASGDTIWKNPQGFGSVVLAGSGSSGTADGAPQQAKFKFSGTGVPVPQFQLPMVADSVGNLYLCDDNNLGRVAKDGFVTTLTGRPGTMSGVGVSGLQDQPFSVDVQPGRSSCGALALRGDKTIYVGRGAAVLKLQLP